MSARIFDTSKYGSDPALPLDCTQPGLINVPHFTKNKNSAVDERAGADGTIIGIRFKPRYEDLKERASGDFRYGGEEPAPSDVDANGAYVYEIDPIPFYTTCVGSATAFAGDNGGAIYDVTFSYEELTDSVGPTPERTFQNVQPNGTPVQVPRGAFECKVIPSGIPSGSSARTNLIRFAFGATNYDYITDTSLWLPCGIYARKPITFQIPAGSLASSVIFRIGLPGSGRR